jgi:hypothetical protein
MVVFAAAGVGCSGERAPARRQPAYLADDPCHANTGQDACVAQDGCTWIALGAPCEPDKPCVDGVCQAIDPCGAYSDEAMCSSDDRCMWAETDLLCPASSPDCKGGFCTLRRDDGCVCACPAACAPGEDCPPCECGCPGGGGGGGDPGGGTCTCVCPACPDGERCPPCDCTCDGGGDTCGGTCTCTVTNCELGSPCPPPDCTCTDPNGGSQGGPQPSPRAPTPEPCALFTSPETCVADPALACRWVSIGAPCEEGKPCVSGVCLGAAPDPCD